MGIMRNETQSNMIPFKKDHKSSTDELKCSIIAQICQMKISNIFYLEAINDLKKWYKHGFNPGQWGEGEKQWKTKSVE